MRAVFDTNVLIDAFSDDFSAQAQLLQAVMNGQVQAIYTDQVEREYQILMHRLISDAAFRERLQAFIGKAELVQPARVSVQIDDGEDMKFLAAAHGGRVDFVVTNDWHLLDVGEVEGVEILTPQEAWARVTQTTSESSEWTSWAKGIGI